MAKRGDTRPKVCVNRRARHDYDFEDRFEAGVVLVGSEVKALREGKGNLVDAYVRLRSGRAEVVNLEISAYSHDATGAHEPRRVRPLLLHAAEIQRLERRIKEKGLVLIPLSVYFKGPWAKLEVGVGRGRKRHDKREVLKKKEARRDVDRELRRR